MPPDEAFPQRLRHARLALGLTQAQLARQIGIRREHLNILEHGRSSPTITTLAKLAQALEVTTDYLLGLTDTPRAGEGGALEQIAAPLSPSNYQWMIGLVKVLIDEQQVMQQRVQQGQVELQPIWGKTG